MKDKLISTIQRLIKNELVSGSFYIFIGSMGANVLAFIFNLFLAHKLTYSDYGIYSALITIINLISIPSQSLTTIVVQFATEYLSRKEAGHATNLYIKSTKIIIVIAGVLLIVPLIFSMYIQEFLHINNIWLILATVLTICASYLNIVNTAFLQSLLRFGFLGFVTFLNGFLKITLGIAFVLLGMQVLGSLWAIVISFFIPLLLCFYPLRLFFHQKQEGIRLPIKSMIRYALPTTLAIFSLSSLTSTDIILVKHFFSAHDAGLYGGLSLIGKVIFYFTGPIPMVMFPLLIKRYNEKKAFHNLFYLALLMIIIPSFSIAIFYFIFPTFVVKLFLGGREYLRIVPYLGVFGLYIALFSIVNIIVSFFLSVKQTKVAYIIAAGAGAQIILISLFHNSFRDIISISLSIITIMLVILLFYYFKAYGKKK